MGYKVKVIHYRSVFPRIFYAFAIFFLDFAKKFYATDFIPIVRLNSSEYTVIDGVEIVTRPIFKLIPHIRFSSRVLNKHISVLVEENQAQKFIPDVIIGHFLNPQLELLYRLKFEYKDVKTSLVLHEHPQVINMLFGGESKKLLDSLDYLGFRFDNMKNIFIEFFGERENLFICPSGIPERYILNEVPKFRHRSKIIRITFVGMLIPLKNVDITLKALVKAFPQKNFQFTLIGEGMLRSDIISQIKEFGLSNQVTLLGKKSREEVQKALVNTDVFVMVSSPEAFGLVYLEAMGKGCLTIGTKRQGIDGVIVHGENGFLCEARNVQSLVDVFLRIQEMKLEEKIAMSEKAMLTAREMTDENIAASYLQKIHLV